LNDLKQNMLLNQLQTGIINSSFSLPNEIIDTIKLAKQQRDISYAIIPLAKFKNDITISDADIQKYYQNNQQQFALPEQISISYVKLSSANIKNKVQITEKDLQQFYHDNLASFSHPKRWQISVALVPLAKNASAKEIKQAEQTVAAMAQQAKLGISLVKLDPIHAQPAWVTSGQLPKEIESELVKLKPNTISEPINAANGIYLIKVLQIKDAEILPYIKVQEQVKKAYYQQKLNQMFDDASQKLSDLAYTNSNSLTPAADQLGLTIQTTGLFTKAGEKNGLLADQKILAAAFSDSVLRQGYNSDPIEIGPGEIMVLRAKEHKPETIKPLAEVKPAISLILFNQAAEQNARALGTKILADLHQGKTFIQALQEQKLTLKTLNKIDFKTKGISPEMIQAALYLPIPTGKPSYGIASLKDGSVAVIAVNNVYSGDVNQLSSSQMQALKANIALTFGQIDFNLLTNKYIKSAKVKKSE
jgi:peptidyl-prolyl cis-trans isomerase D